ncbi:hypothetical protein [Humibacillus xanthopallidus]|uniref:Uncharacterized protein n=1 Tax=Humibacillus xanthopallidus TaxID=412689 RepID=A0A543HJH5_9MICO|nr:hypothetical protein [Humibacillus xanthopallidus]TQM58492.1 hypothetical protein FBY41_3860 [Humibacillus xanthopallidus]
MEHVDGAVVGALVVTRGLALGLELGLGLGLVDVGAGVTGLRPDDVTAGRVLVPAVLTAVVGRAVPVGLGVGVETVAVGDVSEGVVCGSDPWQAARASTMATATAPAPARVLMHPRRPTTPPTSMEHP